VDVIPRPPPSANGLARRSTRLSGISTDGVRPNFGRSLNHDTLRNPTVDEEMP